MGLREGLVGAWCPSLGPTAGTLLDRSGRNNHGTLVSMDQSTDWVQSGGAGALDFDGTNDYVLIPLRSWYDQLTGNKTVSAWVKTSSPGGSFRTVISRDKTFSITLQNSVFGIYSWADVAFRSSGVNVADGRWHHLLVRVNAGVAAGSQCYVDGVAAGAAFLYSTQAGNATNDISICTALSATNAVFPEYVNCQADDLAVWNRPLTDSEIRQLYQRGRGGWLREPRRRELFFVPPTFRAAWIQRAKLIGGGV